MIYYNIKHTFFLFFLVMTAGALSGFGKQHHERTDKHGNHKTSPDHFEIYLLIGQSNSASQRLIGDRYAKAMLELIK